MTSDDFFSDNAVNKVFGKRPDICFLDGMHRAEYLLRDFINTEKECHSRSVIFMHDCLPSNARMALRTHVEGHPDEGMWQYAWTGDVWKIVPLLKKYRPDLQVHMIDCAPTGLVAVSNLNPESTLLTDSYHNLVAEMRDLDLEAYTIAKLWQNYPVLSSRSLMEHPHDLTLFLNIF